MMQTLLIYSQKPLSVFFIFLFIIMQTSHAQTIPLYKEVPNSKSATNYREKADTGADGIIRISKVSLPQLQIFEVEKSETPTPAVIICPGGGYAILAWNLEGIDVAKMLQSWGICAVVLKYRLPSEEIMKDKSIGPLQDAQQALEYVRENATALNVDPKKVGIMGFSAGGHLASTASTHFDTSVIDNKNNISLRPDFSILAYPVISFSDSIGHIGSRNNLLGKNPSREKINWFSSDKQVTKNTPPAFLVLAANDDAVNPENSIRYFEALRKYNIPAEIHIFQNGGHGFGMRKNNWMPLLKEWLKNNHYL